eukprot:1712739-Lingulodinium_polyedra.AAC.1
MQPEAAAPEGSLDSAKGPVHGTPTEPQDMRVVHVGCQEGLGRSGLRHWLAAGNHEALRDPSSM